MFETCILDVQVPWRLQSTLDDSEHPMNGRRTKKARTRWVVGGLGMKNKSMRLNNERWVVLGGEATENEQQFEDRSISALSYRSGQVVQWKAWRTSN